MRKIFVLLAFLLLLAVPAYAGVVTVDAFLSADDVTIAHLEQFRTRVVDGINNADGKNVQAGTIPSTALDANANPTNRWGEAFNNWVYSGLLPATGTRAAATISAGIGYISGYRVVKDEIIPGVSNYPISSDVYVDISSNGTYRYQAVTINATAPLINTNEMRLAKALTDATDVTSVSDLRVLSVNLSGGNQEDFNIKGMELIWTSTTVVNVDPGVVYHGTTRIVKAAQIPLDITVASNYITGISSRGTSKAMYVYMNSAGTLMLDPNAPNKHNTSGDTAGILYYYASGASLYYRIIGMIALNSTGSGEIISFYQCGNHFAYDDVYNNAALLVQNAGSSTNFAAFSGSIVPTTIVASGAKFVDLDINLAGASVVSFRAAGSSATNGIKTVPPDEMPVYNVPCNSSASVEYKVNAGNVNVRIAGYTVSWR